MPRFIARPVVVEAHQWLGQPLPSDFQIAVLRQESGGRVTIATGDGPRVCSNRGWIVRGPDGTFSVLTEAGFETYFEEQQTTLTLRRQMRKELA